MFPTREHAFTRQGQFDQIWSRNIMRDNLQPTDWCILGVINNSSVLSCIKTSEYSKKNNLIPGPRRSREREQVRLDNLFPSSLKVWAPTGKYLQASADFIQPHWN